VNSVKASSVALFCLCLQVGIASAEEASQPSTTATRPARETTGQSSLPSTAPPAIVSQPTGSHDQDATTKKMNDEAKKKLEIEGK
jgi:hypothetical protein